MYLCIAIIRKGSPVWCSGTKRGSAREGITLFFLSEFSSLVFFNIKYLEVSSFCSTFAAFSYNCVIMNNLNFDSKTNDSLLNRKPQTFSRFTQRKKSLSYSPVFNCHNYKEGGEI